MDYLGMLVSIVGLGLILGWIRLIIRLWSVILCFWWGKGKGKEDDLDVLFILFIFLIMWFFGFRWRMALKHGFLVWIFSDIDFIIIENAVPQQRIVKPPTPPPPNHNKNNRQIPIHPNRTHNNPNLTLPLTPNPTRHGSILPITIIKTLTLQPNPKENLRRK